MAAGNVDRTPQRVRELLSSFIYSEDSNDRIKSTAPDDSSEAQYKLRATSDPRNKDSFLQRVETYAPLACFAKLSELSPLSCARYGWENIESDILRCATCHAVLCTQMPESSDLDIYNNWMKTLQEKLVSGHESLCQWSSQPSPESFLELPFYKKKEMIKELRLRVDYLSSIKDSLPEIDDTELRKWGITLDKLASMVESLRLLDKDSYNQLNVTILILAVSGWANTEYKSQVISCEFCRRKVGLWNFHTSRNNDHQSGNESDENPDSSDEPKPKYPKLETRKQFDPISEHRIWCQWATECSPSYSIPFKNEKPLSKTSGGSTVNIQIATCSRVASPQTPDQSVVCDNSQNSSQPGWFRLLQFIIPEDIGKDFNFTPYGSSDLRLSPPFEGLRRIRKAIRHWPSQKSPSIKSTAEEKAT